MSPARIASIGSRSQYSTADGRILREGNTITFYANEDQIERYWRDILAPEMDEACDEAEPQGIAYRGDGSKQILDVRPTHRELLIQKRMVCEKNLSEIDAAIEALDKNPGVVDVLDKLAKVLRRL